MASRVRADIILNKNADGPVLASEGIDLSPNKNINFTGGNTVITQSGITTTSISSTNISATTITASGSTFGSVDINRSSISIGSTTITASGFSGSGSNLTQLNASNISTGLLSPSILGTGTANNSTYLRGDGSWVTISAAGAVINDDTSTNTTYYPALSTATTGTLSSIKISSPKLTFNPNTGTLYTNILNTPSLITSKIYEPITINPYYPLGTIPFYVLSQTLYYYTSAPAAGVNASWGLNITGDATTPLDNIISIGQALTITIMVTNGSTGYLPSPFLIDGISRTVIWQGGTAPTAGSVNAIDMWTYSIVKTLPNTYTVFGSQTKFA
jgi:hypothetical protein